MNRLPSLKVWGKSLSSTTVNLNEWGGLGWPWNFLRNVSPISLTKDCFKHFDGRVDRNSIFMTFQKFLQWRIFMAFLPTTDVMFSTTVGKSTSISGEEINKFWYYQWEYIFKLWVREEEHHFVKISRNFPGHHTTVSPIFHFFFSSLSNNISNLRELFQIFHDSKNDGVAKQFSHLSCSLSIRLVICWISLSMFWGFRVVLILLGHICVAFSVSL